MANAVDSRLFGLVVSDGHEVHRVRDRDYKETPQRLRALLAGVEAMPIWDRLPLRQFGEDPILAVHDSAFFRFMGDVINCLEPGEELLPSIVPIRNRDRLPADLTLQAPYYSLDTFTPITRNGYVTARKSVDCALTAAEAMLDGARAAYALIRPPGHHAEHRYFGGYCYFNSLAVAANYLSRRGKVAVFDLDYHHGNGQQEIFYRRNDVLTMSIHGHPSVAFPYFSGFEDETGTGAGEGFNLNVPLMEGVDGDAYRRALDRLVRRAEEFGPACIVVALGLDTARNDPAGTWLLRAEDFRRNGQAIGAFRLPTLVVQEGGYHLRTLGVNARSFFEGLWEGMGGA
ncbi:MAG: histone deacetylase family protein [SAR202 cluster bacterium]|nr:histone deacetylase family protein [SAR202 cluster bacterium]